MSAAHSKIYGTGCGKLLRLLTNDDLFALNDTVTNKMIAVGTTEEAIDAIITYSKNSEELLKRKKVHRDIIFKYLASEGVVMSVNSEKHQLVKKTLEFWSSRENQSHTVSCEVQDDGLSDIGLLGRQFCQWFFQLLNSQNPSAGQEAPSWGPQHFWPDVRLRLLARTQAETSEEFHGAEMVSLRLLSMCRDERLLFSPNLDPKGQRTLSSVHGLVIVAVAGTVHRSDACLGIFEQVFGLIRSPVDDNSWKIKFVDLKIKAQDCIRGDEELVSPSLTYSSSELQMLCN